MASALLSINCVPVLWLQIYISQKRDFILFWTSICVIILPTALKGIQHYLKRTIGQQSGVLALCFIHFNGSLLIRKTSELRPNYNTFGLNGWFSIVKNYLPNLFSLEFVLLPHSLCIDKLCLKPMGHTDLCWQIPIIPNSAGPGTQVLLASKVLPCACLKTWGIKYIC